MFKRLVLALSLLGVGGIAFASGNVFVVPVSSGNAYANVETYINNTGNSRQAVVIGDKTSSDTVHVDQIQGMQVYLGTSSASNIGTIGNTGFNVTGTLPAFTATPAVFLATTSVVASTVAVTNVSGQNLNVNVAAGSIANTGFNVTGTLPAFAATPAVFLSTVQVVTSTVAVTNVSGQNLNVNLAAGSIANTGFNVNNSPTVVLTTAAVSGSTVAVVNGVGTKLLVTPDSVALPANQSVNVSQWNAATAVTGGTSGSVGVGGLSANGSAEAGNPVALGVLVSSATTMPTVQANTTMQTQMGDKFGRGIILPMVPVSNVLFATATLNSTTSETVFISSGGATNLNHLIGCIGQNSSATNTYVTFRSSATGVQNNSFTLGFPANDTPVGFFPPGGIPQLTYNAQWTVQAANSVASLFLTCEYYLEP